MESKTVIACTTIICITMFGIVCVFKGIDSTVISLISSIIGTVLGYTLGKKA